MHSLRRSFVEKSIPIDCQLDLFEKTIEPILLYGAEVWGRENTSLIEKFRLKAFKQILKVKNSTPSYMVYGEIGKVPIEITIKDRMYSFWSRLVTGNANKISFNVLKIMMQDTLTDGREYKWLKKIESILNDTGFRTVWLSQSPTPQIDSLVKQTIYDQGIQNLQSQCRQSNKGKGYLNIKNDWYNTEFYLTVLDNENTIALTKFRTANHRLPIELGRYINLPVEERKCPIKEK